MSLVIFLVIFLIIERVPKDSILSQNSTCSTVVPPAAPRSPPVRPLPLVSRNEKIPATPIRNVDDDNQSTSCSSPSSTSENEDPVSDVENEDPQPQSISTAIKRARADATSTESLSPPRNSVTNTTRMMLRSSARKQHQPQQIPVSTPSFRQQRKHRRVDLDITPLNSTNHKKLPPTQSSTPHANK